jgi:uncharacterized RDD family membrane protein YckC
MTENAKEETPIYVARIAAFLIDALIYSAIVMITISAAHLIFNLLSQWFPAYIDSDTVKVWRYGTLITVLPLYYTICLTSKFQATPGKYFMGIYVATTKGNKLKAIHALARYFGCFAFSIWVYAPYVVGALRMSDPNFDEAKHAMDADVINFVLTNFILLIFFLLKPYDLLLFTRIYRTKKENKLAVPQTEVSEKL